MLHGPTRFVGTKVDRDTCYIIVEQRQKAIPACVHKRSNDDNKTLIDNFSYRNSLYDYFNILNLQKLVWHARSLAANAGRGDGGKQCGSGGDDGCKCERTANLIVFGKDNKGILDTTW